MENKYIYIQVDNYIFSDVIKVTKNTRLKDILKVSNNFLKSKKYNLKDYSLIFALDNTSELQEETLMDEKYQNWSPYDQIVKDEPILIYTSPERTQFTGNKDVDLEILKSLEDKDLLNMCKTNKYLANLCKDDNFWKNRFEEKYNGLGYKPKKQTWKEYYIDSSKKYEIYNLGDILSASYGYSSVSDYYKVVGFTKSGNPIIAEIEKIIISEGGDPSFSCEKFTLNIDKIIGPTYNARYSKNKGWGFTSDKTRYNLFKVKDPSRVFENCRYW